MHEQAMLDALHAEAAAALAGVVECCHDGS
jgi:hypothetical protein